jgi:hypothetical protein
MLLEHYLADKPELAEVVRGRLAVLAGYDADAASPPGAQSRMVGYIEHDPMPPEALWADLCDRLNAADDRPGSIRDAVVEWGRAPGHSLAVPARGLGPECIYASCMTMESFCGTLEDHRLVMPGAARAYEWITRTLARPDAAYQSRRLRAVVLKEYTMWATFDEADQARDPMDLLGADHYLICARLGLSRSFLGEMLLVFRYRLPEGVRPSIATAATVAAGSPWHEYWQSGRAGEGYGHTQPWPEHGRAKRCPGVVHPPIKGAYLVRPVARLTPRTGGRTL